ncbi:GntR family transcriptional regulator [Corynebacterium sp.]|uniref:GntR family transcriptional regulator n=1 Tax=Corynebacterium sp. TaxID=1720 RepID=UPI002906FCCE|nr:GntR family transcriptional regulator [Corynebacterium sp.]MDU4569909.1 GntR family transcriptional regulator [Corynebacterium sp.]
MSPRDKQQHRKIADYLREQISSGVLQPGDFLPSEADLCEKFSSSRGPVRQAVAALRAKGLVSSGRGRRSTVLASTQAELFESIYSISSWLSEYDADPQQHTLWLARRRAPREITRFLRVDPEQNVVFVHRVRYTEDHPIAIERMYFPMVVGKHILDFDADGGSIHAHLRECGVDFDNVRRELTLEEATAEDAEALEVATGTPLWRLQMEISNHSGEPVEMAVYLYRADRMKLAMNNVRGGVSPLEVIPTPGNFA